MSGFIWNGRNQRIRRESLQRHRLHGGLSLPNFQYYYWSADIKNIMHWIHFSRVEDPGPKWLELECGSCTKTSLHALAWSKIPFPESISTYCINPVVRHSLKIWIQFRRAFSLTKMSIDTPLVGNNMFAPSITDDAFKIWTEKGLKTVKDVYIGGTFASFEHLRTHFDIPNSHFFRYLQLRSFVYANVPSFPLISPDSLLDKILKMPLWPGEVVGRLYSILSMDNLKPLTTLKHQ